MLFDEPIGVHFTEERTVAGSDSTYCLNRQCALCDHACLNFEWLCTCCSYIDGSGPGHRPRICSQPEERISRPLLPPHWPKHARAHLVVTVVPPR